MPSILTASRRALFGLLLALLAGCGLKGDLYLPGDDDPAAGETAGDDGVEEPEREDG